MMHRSVEDGYWITSSAVANSVSVMVRPSALELSDLSAKASHKWLLMVQRSSTVGIIVLKSLLSAVLKAGIVLTNITMIIFLWFMWRHQ